MGILLAGDRCCCCCFTRYAADDEQPPWTEPPGVQRPPCSGAQQQFCSTPRRQARQPRIGTGPEAEASDAVSPLGAARRSLGGADRRQRQRFDSDVSGGEGGDGGGADCGAGLLHLPSEVLTMVLAQLEPRDWCAVFNDTVCHIDKSRP